MNKRFSVFSFLATFILFGNVALAQTTDATAPSEVAKAPTVVSGGDGQVTLKWDVATDNVGVTGYKLYYDTVSLETKRQSNPDTAAYAFSTKVDNVNQFTVTGLMNGTKYYFSVTALDAAGNESEYYSPETEATPVAGVVDSNANMNAAPVFMAEATDLAVVENNGSLNLSWKPAAGVTSQMLYISKDNGTTFGAGTDVGTVSSYLLPFYDAQAQYVFKLTSKDATGNENAGVTLPWSKSTDLPTIVDVSNLMAKFERVLNKYTVTLTWDLPQDVSDIVSQIVYQSLDGSVFTQLASLAPTVTTYQLKNLAAGKYFFKVTTKDKNGQESAGVVQTVELPATGPALALMAGLSLLGAGFMISRKKKTVNK